MMVVDHLRVKVDHNHTGEHRHSFLSFALRSDVIESGYMLHIGAAHMISTSAALSHPRFDPEKCSELLQRTYYDTLGAIPYMTKGKTGTDIMVDERMKAVQAYLDMKKRAMKDPKS